MIQRVKLPVTCSLVRRYRIRLAGGSCGPYPNSGPLTSEQTDEQLDNLVKHALKTAPQLDGGRIWQQITRKVRGPFGTTALEAPAQSSLDMELMASGGRIQPAPFALSDRVRRSEEAEAVNADPWCTMLRFISSSISRAGYAWLLN